MNTLVRDVRYALATARRNKGFAIAAVLTLALGIGATTAVFSAQSALGTPRLGPQHRAATLMSCASWPSTLNGMELTMFHPLFKSQQTLPTNLANV
jgi:hypothetical protein